MLYCAGYTVSFQEVPDEVSLVLLISECTHNCPGCHSPELHASIGEILNEGYIDDLLRQYDAAVTCVCFMGEGRNLPEVCRLARYVHTMHGLKTALYTGLNDEECVRWYEDIRGSIDYLKTGPYVAAAGGLNSPTTNQRMYKLYTTGESFEMKDVTHRFWRMNDP